MKALVTTLVGVLFVGLVSVAEAAPGLPCSKRSELAKPYLWKSSTSSHIGSGDVRQRYQGSFIGQRNRSRIPSSSQVKILDSRGNVVGYTCKYAQLGTYQFRYYNGTCPSNKRASNRTIQNRAVQNTGSRAVYLYVSRDTCLKLSKGPTVTRQGAVR